MDFLVTSSSLLSGSLDLTYSAAVYQFVTALLSTPILRALHHSFHENGQFLAVLSVLNALMNFTPPSPSSLPDEL